MEQRYTAAQFIAAIKGSGGVISAIADAVGCDWHTARKFADRKVYRVEDDERPNVDR